MKHEHFGDMAAIAAGGRAAEAELEGVVIGKNGGTGTCLVGRVSFNDRLIAIFRVFLVAFLLAGLAGCGAPTTSRSSQKKTTVRSPLCGPHLKKYDETRKKEAWTMISEYSPEGAFMIGEVRKRTNELCGKPSEFFVSFITGDKIVTEDKKERKYYMSISTSVHEMAHLFSTWVVARDPSRREARNGLAGVTDKSPYSLAFYLAGKGTVYVPGTKTFAAKRIASRVPEELRDHMYTTYIHNDTHVSSVTGVYGLLDEFHAYYHDHQAMERMLRSEELRFFEPTDYLKFLYFKYYILEYLDYAREHEWEIFKGIMANGIFVETFLDVHDRFEMLHVAHLEFRSRNVIKDGDMYRFGKTYVMSPGIDKTYAALTRVLDQKKFENLMALLRTRRG